MVTTPLLGRRRLAGGAFAALFIMGCGGIGREDLVDAYLAENPELGRATSGCVIDHLIGEYGIDDLEARLDAGVDDEFELTHFRARFGCGVTGDVANALRPQLADRGLDPEAADCVAETLSDEMRTEDLEVLLTGPMTDEFYARYFDALEHCDAL